MSGETSRTSSETIASSLSVAPKRKSSLPLLLVVVLLGFGGGGGAAWYVMQRGRSAEAAQTAEADQPPKYIVALEGFTVNLADSEDNHFLRVTMDLGIDRLPEGADREKPASAVPIARIRDSVLSVLTVCRADPLLTPEGKEQLKKNLLQALRRDVPELDVREIYFTEFLVQR
ncbi:MAG TPA: flagellar basal body-associated FliL family protein [Terriglobales bacterium]|nr:flagellar basal body-associated FliL family protein [Terriglobales bacterium]